jgi:predicted nucleic acid-binding protein
LKFLLDTCLISELIRTEPDSNVLKWLAEQNELNLYLSALTLGELQKGIAKLPPSTKRKRIQTWVDNDLLQRFSNRILPIDTATASLWGNIQGAAEPKGKPMPTIDGLLAATALTHQLTVATRNGTDMAVSGVSIFNPWKAPSRTKVSTQ